MRQKIVIQLGIFCCLIYPLETAITLTTISSLPTRGNFPCGETVTLMCEAPSYSGFLTWEVNLVSMAQCVSGTCSTNPPLPANYNFVFDTTNRIFNFTISPVVIGDNGTEFKCDDTSSSSSFTSLVKVVPTSSGVVYTNTSTANGVDIVLTTGCAYPADVDITWYYKKNITGASRELYTKTSPVTVTDVACQSGNCGLATASKKRSTVRIETSNTGGNQYIFEAFIKHPDASGYYFPVGTYTLADSTTTIFTPTNTTAASNSATTTTTTTTTATNTTMTSSHTFAAATVNISSSSSPTMPTVNSQKQLPLWSLIVIGVTVVTVALLAIIVCILLRKKRERGKQTQKENFSKCLQHDNTAL